MVIGDKVLVELEIREIVTNKSGTNYNLIIPYDKHAIFNSITINESLVKETVDAKF